MATNYFRYPEEMATAVPQSQPEELVIEVPGTSSYRITLDKERYRLGRSAGNELSFPFDPKLSREHLVFERSTEGWIVRDLGSRNGTQINGAPLTQATQLRPGDRIMAGHLTICYGSQKESSHDETH